MKFNAKPNGICNFASDDMKFVYDSTNFSKYSKLLQNIYES